MPQPLRKTLAITALAAGLLASPLATSHFVEEETLQSYRQSWFAMVAMNFGPMVSMLKGEMPWDEQRLATWSEQLEQLTAMDISRGFSPGSVQGTTRAKPEIWENRADFDAKLQDLREASVALQAAVAGGERKAIAAAIQDTGKTCKACHDEYKSQDYLY